MNKLWEWIRDMLDRLFRRKRHTATESLECKEHRHDREHDLGSAMTTTRGRLNMPKRQPCPLCRASVKRKRKTWAGAHYYCNKCKNGLFVRAR